MVLVEPEKTETEKEEENDEFIQDGVCFNVPLLPKAHGVIQNSQNQKSRLVSDVSSADSPTHRRVQR